MAATKTRTKCLRCWTGAAGTIGAHPFSLPRKRLAENTRAGCRSGLRVALDRRTRPRPSAAIAQPCPEPRAAASASTSTKRNTHSGSKASASTKRIETDVWIADGNPQDREIEELASLPTGSVVVNLFAGGRPQIRMRIDDGAWQPLWNTKGMPPTVHCGRDCAISRVTAAIETRTPLPPPQYTLATHIWTGRFRRYAVRTSSRMYLEARDATADGAVKLIDTRVIFAP